MHRVSMDAQTLRCLAVVLCFVAVTATNEAATHQTVNFSVTARNPEIAEQVGKAAEVYRQQLAIFWLGKPLPNWSRPCKIAVNEGALGAGGQTTFQFVRGEVLNWRMEVQGSLERILDSVLPHEVNHTIFACHFRRPLPRWADEGAATLFEHRSEQLKQLSLLNEVIRSKHEFITLRDLLAMKEYPRGQRPMLTLYAQGYALADFLVQQKGRHAYLKFIADGERGSWDEAIRTNFDHDGIESLERNWRGWVLAGMPKLTLPRDQMLAANEEIPEALSQETARPETIADPTTRLPLSKPRLLADNATVRLQSPDPQPVRPARVPGNTLDAPLVGFLKENASDQTVADGRPSSFNAPLPNSYMRHSGDAAVETSSGKGLSDATDGAEIIRHGATNKSTSQEPGTVPRFSQAEEDRMFGVPERRRQLEQTGSARTLEAAGRESDEAGKSVKLDGVLLPRERTGNSGSTPQWAGFPGQKKLF